MAKSKRSTPKTNSISKRLTFLQKKFDDGVNFFEIELSPNIMVRIRKYNGKMRVDIRKVILKEDSLIYTKKGVGMDIAAWLKFN